MVSGNVFYVPWPDLSEWSTVREQIFSPNVQDTIAAYHTILMWKLKYDCVPAYIECTYSILQVMVKEYEMTKNEERALLFNENDLRLSYSTALIRFVNHVSSISSYKGETLYLAAKTQNIPDWIINMRHDVAHGQNLPALDALHIAAELSLKWLLDNYWSNLDICEQKTVDVSQFDIDSSILREIDVDVQNFFKKFFDIWELYHDAKYKKVQFITQVDREFILLVEEMLSLNNVYFNNLENESTVEIQNIVNAYSEMEENGDFEPKILCHFVDFKILLLKFIKNIIKGNDQLKHSLVIALFETTFLFVIRKSKASRTSFLLSENSFNPSKWQEMICFLQEIGSFSFLLEILFQMAGKGHEGASKWLSILPPSIRHLKKQWAIFKVLKKENNNYKTKLLKKKVQNTCKPTDPSLLIQLDIFKPPVITLEMMKNILLNPEHFTVENVVEYLELVKPPLMKFTIDMIKDLVSLHVGAAVEEAEGLSEEKIFTLDDLSRVVETEKTLVFEEAGSGSNGWIRSSIDIAIWNKCPLGLLPFQTKVDCNLPGHLTWERKMPSRKRVSIPLLKHSESMKKFKEI